MPVSYFRLDDLMRRESDMLSACYTWLLWHFRLQRQFNIPAACGGFGNYAVKAKCYWLTAVGITYGRHRMPRVTKNNLIDWTVMFVLEYF